MRGFVSRFFLSEIISNFFHTCYLRMRQDNAVLHAAMMARADTVIVCSLPLAQKIPCIRLLVIIANHHHARRGVVYAPRYAPSRKEQGVSRVASHWPARPLIDRPMDKPSAPVRTGGEAAPKTGEKSLGSGEDSTKQLDTLIFSSGS